MRAQRDQVRLKPAFGNTPARPVYDGATSRAGDHIAVLCFGRANLKQIMTALTLAAFAVAILPAAPGRASSVSQWFWFQGPSGWNHAPLTLVARGNLVRVFATNTRSTTVREATSLVRSYERRILPDDLRLFGAPRRLGVVQILLVPLQPGILGYFDPTDLSSSAASFSNRGNVLYVRPAETMPDKPALTEVQEVVAHELCHLIQYRLRVLDRRLPQQATWLNEGLAFYAQLGEGFWTQRDVIKVRAATAAPSWPVDDLHANDNFLRRHARVAYGRAGMFVTYLAGRYGTRFVRDLVVDRHPGLAGVATELHAVDSAHSLSDVFADWGVAQQLHGRGRYACAGMPAGYPPRPHAAIVSVGTYPWASSASSGGLTLAPFGQAYVRFLTNRIVALHLSVSGPSGQMRAAVILQDSDHVVDTQVRWLRFDSRGEGSIRIDGYGGLYDRLTLAISRVSSLSAAGQRAQPVHVRAELWRDREVAAVARASGGAKGERGAIGHRGRAA